MDSAYIVPHGKTETVRTYRRRVYDTIVIVMNTETKPPNMRIERLWPNIEWPRIWKNLWAAPVTDWTKTTWYKIIHDIVPTKERLHKIRVAPTENCRLCDRKENLLHRLAECGDGRYQWEWTKKRLAIMLRSDPRWVPEEWLLRPHFTFWPPQRQFVGFRSQLERNLTFQDYSDFLRRSKYKFYRKRNRITQVGNYLSILEIDQGWNPVDEQKKLPNVATTRWMHPGTKNFDNYIGAPQKTAPSQEKQKHITKRTQ